jgi:hypothetical protein
LSLNGKGLPKKMTMRRTILLILTCFGATSAFACRDCNPDYRWTISVLGGECGLLGWNDGGPGTLIICNLDVFLPVSAPVAAAAIPILITMLCSGIVVFRNVRKRRNVEHRNAELSPAAVAPDEA